MNDRPRGLEQQRAPARLLALSGLILLLGLGFTAGFRDSGAVPKGKVVGIRTGTHGDSTRVVLDLEGSPPCSIRQTEGTEDWEILVANVCPGDPPPALTPGGSLISIESACEGPDLRIVLRTARPLVQTAFRIPAGHGKNERYVVDLRPAVPAENRQGPPSSSLPAGEEKPSSVSATSGSRGEKAAEPEPPPRRKGSWRILVDPGHGGSDPGAQRKGIREKEIVLDVARRVALGLNGRPGFEARLSREDDRLIPLRRRMLLAEQYEADAFISIHVNAARRKDAIGVEVFFLSMGGASDEASRELARLENEADPDYVVSEDSLLQGIPFSFDLRQSDTLLRSSRLAESILTSFEASDLAASRGVKQAGFAVLKSFQVPSSLVEIGFLSNPAEARRLKDPKHRQRLADCIVKGTTEYFDRFARTKAGG